MAALPLTARRLSLDVVASARSVWQMSRIVNSVGNRGGASTGKALAARKYVEKCPDGVWEVGHCAGRDEALRRRQSGGASGNNDKSPRRWRVGRM